MIDEVEWLLEEYNPRRKISYLRIICKATDMVLAVVLHTAKAHKNVNALSMI